MYHLAIASTVLALGTCAGPQGPHHGHEGHKGMGMGMKDKTMSFFFTTSTNPGKGADLGGLAGADAHCAALAESAGLRSKNWKAFLSSTQENARDRIAKGPWMNAKGGAWPPASTTCTATRTTRPRPTHWTKRAWWSTAAAMRPTATM